MNDPSNDEYEPSGTGLTAEEVEAISAFKSRSAGPALRGFQDASDRAHERERSTIDFTALLESLAKKPAFLAPSDRYMKAMRVNAARERSEAQRKVEDSENFKLMAGLLVEMDRERKANQEDRRRQAVFNTWIAIVGAVLACGSVVVPFVIEAMKGWR